MKKGKRTMREKTRVMKRRARKKGKETIKNIYIGGLR